MHAGGYYKHAPPQKILHHHTMHTCAGTNLLEPNRVALPVVRARVPHLRLQQHGRGPLPVRAARRRCCRWSVPGHWHHATQDRFGLKALLSMLLPNPKEQPDIRIAFA